MQDADMRAFLTELYTSGKQNDDQEQERSKKMLIDNSRECMVQSVDPGEQSGVSTRHGAKTS
jgi:hypothetical protein